MITNREYWLIMVTAFVVLVFTMGAAMNFVVVESNDWKMPVFLNVNANASGGHFYYSEKSEVKFHFLADKFHFSGYILSLGDLVMILGGCLFISWLTFVIIEHTKYIKWKRKNDGRIN